MYTVSDLEQGAQLGLVRLLGPAELLADVGILGERFQPSRRSRLVTQPTPMAAVTTSDRLGVATA